MVLMSATGPVHERWRAELAATGLVNGTSHAQDMVMRAAMPEVYLGTIRDIKAFADWVCSAG